MLSNSKCQHLDYVTAFMMLPCIFPIQYYFENINISLNFTGIRQAHSDVKNIKDYDTGPTN